MNRFEGLCRMIRPLTDALTIDQIILGDQVVLP